MLKIIGLALIAIVAYGATHGPTLAHDLAGGRPAALAAQPHGDDWLDNQLAEATALRECDLINAAAFAKVLDSDRYVRTKFRIGAPRAPLIRAELATLRLHSCGELATMPFAHAWTDPLN